MVNINYFILVIIVIGFIFIKIKSEKDIKDNRKQLDELTEKLKRRSNEIVKMIKYRNVSMIACVTETGLLGDAEPEEGTNGLLWHVPEELQHFKSLTKDCVLVFGENTAKFVPIEKIRKSGRIVEIMTYENTLDDILNKYPENEIMICGGASVYKWCLENIYFKAIYLSILNEDISVKEAKKPLYLPDPAEYGYDVAFKYPYEYFTFVVFTRKVKKEGE